MTARGPLIGEPPPPAVPAKGRCRAGRLTAIVVPWHLRRYRPTEECYDAAARRVQIGMDVIADVCLWHSLTACEQLGAHLIRSP